MPTEILAKRLREYIRSSSDELMYPSINSQSYIYWVSHKHKKPCGINMTDVLSIFLLMTNGLVNEDTFQGQQYPQNLTVSDYYSKGKLQKNSLKTLLIRQEDVIWRMPNAMINIRKADRKH